MPHRERHAESELRQTANGETAEHPQTILWPDDEQQIAGKKSSSTRNQQKAPWSETARRPKEQGKDQIKLDEHGKIPPRRVEVHEVHLNIDEAQAEQTQHDAIIHGFETRDERRDQINHVRHPVHRIKPQKPRAIPCTPGDRIRFGPACCRVHERPPAKDDEYTDGMETEPRYFKP